MVFLVFEVYGGLESLLVIASKVEMLVILVSVNIVFKISSFWIYD